jgi:hypothetical protein
MKSLLSILLLIAAGCSTSSPKREFPDCVAPQCYGALNHAESVLGMSGRGDWIVITQPATEQRRGVWHFVAPDGSFCAGWTEGNGKRTYLPANPGNLCDINLDTLQHEAAHHVLLTQSPRIPGHPAQYKPFFVDWNDPR